MTTQQLNPVSSTKLREVIKSMTKHSALSRAINKRNRRFKIKNNDLRHNVIHLGMRGGSHLFGTPMQGRGASRQPTNRRDRGSNLYSVSGRGSYHKHKIPVKHKGEYVYKEVKDK